MAKKRKNFIREKRIYCGEEYLEVDIVAVTNMPEAGKGKKGKSSQAQKNLNDKRSKRTQGKNGGIRCNSICDNLCSSCCGTGITGNYK